jgi:hypothetical protein
VAGEVVLGMDWTLVAQSACTDAVTLAAAAVVGLALGAATLKVATLRPVEVRVEPDAHQRSTR